MIATLKFHFACDNRKTYRAIAREFDTSALHVYRLAHGRRGKNDKDYYIIKRLKEEGVLISTFV
ncbi:MAG: hypothetical protein LLF81_01775 [Porphyromonadaceae bacterium]|nr:hypothetical protein [Porphyromonadaceae bacterium]